MNRHYQEKFGNSLGYIIIDANFFNRSEVMVVRSKYGNDGLIIILAIRALIAQNGYYIEWDENMQKEVRRIHVPEMSFECFQEVIDLLVDLSLYHRFVCGSKVILTSKTAQKAYLKTKYDYGVRDSLKEEYLLKESKAYIARRLAYENDKRGRKENSVPEEEPAGNETVPEAELFEAEDSSPHACVGAPVFQQNKTIQNNTKQNNINYSSSNNNLNKEREENACAKNSNNINSLDLIEKIGKELVSDPSWCDSVAKFTRKGDEIVVVIPEAVKCFINFLLITGCTEEIRTKKEFEQRFLGFWRYNNFTTDMEELATGRKERPKARKESRTEEMERVKEEARALLRQKREGRK